MSEHLRRMVALADDFFSAKNDPEQLDVTPEVMAQLERIHPATLSEEAVGDGPVVWVLLIPTTDDTMKKFIEGIISEKQLLQESSYKNSYDSLYLCSVLVLPEFRRQGRAFRTACEAIGTIMKDHRIRSFYTWNFSDEGKKLAVKLATHFGVPLSER
ncbi:MAG: hypothetical protein ACKOA1_09040 [Bacteroidota bacterium]